MTTPPFFGTKVLADISVEDVEKLLDMEALFASRWQLRQGADADAWDRIRSEKAIPIYARLMASSRARKVITPKLVYGYFQCRKQGNGLIVDGGKRSFRFDLPRERQEPHRCLADLFDAGFVAMQVATVGPGAAKAAAESFARGIYTDAFYIKGLAAALAEATAAWGHAMIR
ncbi:MAG: vitamin B12 dependent-methionine synthase activation domain-containing protein, partial [bacterium]